MFICKILADSPWRRWQLGEITSLPCGSRANEHRGLTKSNISHVARSIDAVVRHNQFSESTDTKVIQQQSSEMEFSY